MDPRMAQAVKRDKDRQEILTMLEGFNDPKSAGGADISDKELNLGYSALLKKGYVQEAKEFLAMAQSMRTEVREDKKADAALTRARAALRKAMKEGKMKPAEMSQIEDSIKRALGEEVILTKDASGAVTSVRVNGKDLDNTQIAALNTHIKNALDAYINAGEGAKGYQAVENYVIAKINPTLPGPSQSPSSSGGSTPPPPPGFVPPPPANP